MSLASRTVRGSAWIMATSVGARILGVAGTLLLTRFLAPDAYGEVQAAWVIATTASQFATLGVGQYLIANPTSGRAMAFHATVLHVGLGTIALLGALMLGRPLGVMIGAPGMVIFLPGLVISTLIDRLMFVPERILVRDMRFRDVGIARTVGELSYTLISVGLAMRGFGGMSIVIGYVARCVVRMIMMLSYAPWREWAEPVRIEREKMRTLFAFGLPLSLAGTAAFAARRWDNLLFSGLFGPAAMGSYNLAYNLADIPAVQVGEQITDVLLPSFARVDRAHRERAFVRAMKLVSLLMTPLAVGLGAVAPTLVAALFNDRWRSMGTMLTVLAALSAVRPLSGVMAAYLQVKNRTRAMMLLELLKLGLLVGLILVLGKTWGPLGACVGVGVAFVLHVLAYYVVVKQDEPDLGYRHLADAMLPPLVACVPMVLAVLATRAGLTHITAMKPAIGVVIEIIAGGLAFMLAALVVAKSTSQDFLNLVKTSLLRRGGSKSDKLPA